MEFPVKCPQFFTATIYEWKYLLKPDKYKRIIIESLAFLGRENRAFIYGFVIMSNHIHLIWQMKAGHNSQNVQRDFLKYTAQAIRFDLVKNHPDVLPHFEVNLKDRKYQFWQRNPLTFDLHNPNTFWQKLNYIHHNPVKAGLCESPIEYEFSSAAYYEYGKSKFDFLSHYEG